MFLDHMKAVVDVLDVFDVEGDAERVVRSNALSGYDEVVRTRRLHIVVGVAAEVDRGLSKVEMGSVLVEAGCTYLGAGVVGVG